MKNKNMIFNKLTIKVNISQFFIINNQINYKNLINTKTKGKKIHPNITTNLFKNKGAYLKYNNQKCHISIITIYIKQK